MNAVSMDDVSVESVLSALLHLDDDDLTQIENRIKEIRAEGQSRDHQKIKELEAQIRALKAKSRLRVMTKLVNPNNPKEVYTTGQYKPWVTKLAKSKGVDPDDKKAMKQFIKDNSK